MVNEKEIVNSFTSTYAKSFILYIDCIAGQHFVFLIFQFYKYVMQKQRKGACLQYPRVKSTATHVCNDRFIVFNCIYFYSDGIGQRDVTKKR